MSDDRVKLEVEVKGSKENSEAKVVVITTGFGSRLTQRLGLGEIGDFAMGAQIEVGIGEVDELEVYFGRGIAPGFFAWLVPTSPGKALAGLLSYRSPVPYLKSFLSTLYNGAKIDSTEGKITSGSIPLRPLPKTYRERVLGVGDAAGQVKPTTGGGIYYGFLCAGIAVDTLDRAFSVGDFSAKRLSQYEKGWKKKLSGEIRIDRYARGFFKRLSDGQINQLFDIIQAKVDTRSLLESGDFSFDWHSALILRLLRHEAMHKTTELRHFPSKLKELVLKQRQG